MCRALKQVLICKRSNLVAVSIRDRVIVGFFCIIPHPRAHAGRLSGPEQ